MTEKIDMDERAKAMAEEIPGVMNALMGLHSEVVKDGALSAKTKELMMVGIAVAIRCEYCLWKHVPEAVKMGATREEILEAVSTAIMMSGGPGVAYG
ncbi:4-carboxymuconolactone decarboxylase, partial [Methanosarcina mazei]